MPMKDSIRELLHATPFHPFIIRMADGKDYRVDHPDFVFAPPSKQPWVIIEEAESGRTHRLSVLLIVSIEELTDASLNA